MKLSPYFSIILFIVIASACDDENTTSQRRTPTDKGTATDGKESSNQNTPAEVGGDDSLGASNLEFKSLWGEKDSIQSELALRSYEDWYAESEIHASVGPHGQVRTFLNPVLEQSLRDGNQSHPVGSVAVKELYDRNGDKLVGFAVETKVAASNSGDSWYWYEDLNPDDNRIEFSGLGLSTCTGCHASGVDYVTTGLED